MTDLIARLRSIKGVCDEAADRIEELQAIINQPVPLSEWQKMEAERDQLRAEVVRLKSQEPVVEKLLLEHNGCGHGRQMEQLTIGLHRGDKVFVRFGPYSAALHKSEK